LLYEANVAMKSLAGNDALMMPRVGEIGRRIFAVLGVDRDRISRVRVGRTLGH
jgi:hypothetical protein